MSRPEHCPNCGAPLPEGPQGAQPFCIPKDTEGTDGGWDCFCQVCTWSGDILPDSEVAP